MPYSAQNTTTKTEWVLPYWRASTPKQACTCSCHKQTELNPNDFIDD